MQYVIYVLIKLACYTAWCWLGLRLWQPTSSGWRKATGFGLLRLGIGIVFGVSIFFIIPVQADDVLWKYLTIYTPVRLVEWLILAVDASAKLGRQEPGHHPGLVRRWYLGFVRS